MKLLGDKRVLIALAAAVFVVIILSIFMWGGDEPMAQMDHSKHQMGGKHAMHAVTLSPAAQALAEVQVAVVERKMVQGEVRLFGKVDYDETRVANITSWFPGRIEKMYLNYTGVTVNKGDHMVDIYSPTLIGAQEELLQSTQALESFSGQEQSKSFIHKNAKANAQASREKLLLWGISEERVQDLERTKKVDDIMTVNAPMSGVVIQKHISEGHYVKEGTHIFTIADVSVLWVKLDAYESDLAWLRYGLDVEFTTGAFPGKTFTGTISFIDPFLNEKTRTVAVRVNIKNEDGLLKPGMFLRGVVRLFVTAEGNVSSKGLAGKWIAPMHPHIVKDGPGTCDICGMALVMAEELGFAEEKEEAPLVIPHTAPLLTGKRAIVYVQMLEDTASYMARQVVLGARLGEYYIVVSGLEEGERVVVNGNFKIDSASQIQGKPSMMKPEGGGKPATGHQNH
jgi:membrane fusion protein, copper/silver efflux system